ncbi:DRTGG domain-containing protein [Chloroflexota bacterium]
MVTLFVVSLDSSSGKTALAAGLTKHFLDSGRKVGFIKPGSGGADAAFMENAFTSGEKASMFVAAYSADLKDAVAGMGSQADVIIVEASLGQTSQDAASQVVIADAAALGAKVIAVADYAASTKITDFAGFGESLLGVVLNKVPQSRLAKVCEEVTAQTEIPVLGVIPEARALAALSVGELAERIGGSILNNPEKAAGLVENLMLGALVVDSGRDYFARKANKAAILSHDRPDMQLAALDTSTRCLILSGDTATPDYHVMEKARGKGIPLMVTYKTTGDILDIFTEAMAGARFGQADKIPHIGRLLQENLDYTTLEQKLGTAG